jgi:hypothetical protein
MIHDDKEMVGRLFIGSDLLQNVCSEGVAHINMAVRY